MLFLLTQTHTQSTNNITVMAELHVKLNTTAKKSNNVVLRKQNGSSLYHTTSSAITVKLLACTSIETTH